MENLREHLSSENGVLVYGNFVAGESPQIQIASNNKFFTKFS